MTWGEWLFFPGSEDFKRPRTILASWKNPPNCYQHLKVPCSGMPFFRQKKQTNKQTKTKLNINRDIKEHNNNTRIYQYHGLGPLQRQKYPKSEQFQPNHSLGDFQQFCQKKAPEMLTQLQACDNVFFRFSPIDSYISNLSMVEKRKNTFVSESLKMRLNPIFHLAIFNNFAESQAFDFELT